MGGFLSVVVHSAPDLVICCDFLAKTPLALFDIGCCAAVAPLRFERRGVVVVIVVV